ncbi:MAG TPA: PKD domain-containing protein [Flavisolibacter sp.]
MRYFAALLGIAACCIMPASAQDFSNRGKEFWLAYSYHVGMVNSGGLPVMTLYLTSDEVTNFQVSIYGGASIQSGTINAGQVVTVTIPTTYFIDDEGLFSNKAIRVTGDKPLVVYSYITRAAASGATLCLPTPVLGKEYYSTNFTQASNEANSNSYLTIVAVEDNTAVEVTPAVNTKNGWLAGNTYTVNLNKGQIYQVLGTTSNNLGVDLTGTRIRSVASGTTGCKRIAVFSGSGKIRIPASGCSSNSSDNLYQQLYPTGSWGRKYLTVPSFNHPNNYYRILRSDPSTVVSVNGVVVPSSAFNNNYYQFFSSTPNQIVADKPVSVAQYFTTQGCDGNPSNQPYDPDMIMLNPVEQNISNVTLVSSNLAASQNPPAPAHQHHIHVIIRNAGTAKSSFRLDGIPVPANSWITHPADPAYAYIYLNNVSQGYHRIASDSGFNAIAYGYAQAESYGYSAGANVKDLYQFVSISNLYATVNFPATCRNTPFFFAMTFPYQPTEIKWQFSGLFPDVTIPSPVYDSTWTVNGKQLYRYKLPTAYTIPSTGTYPIRVLAQNPTPDGCSGEQEINYDLQVYERPVADFNFSSTGCVSDPVLFTDSSNTNGRPAYVWSWNFGDNTTGSGASASHQYTAAGSYVVRYSVITDIGCLSDTVSKTLTLAQPPVAGFKVSHPTCVGDPIVFTDSSTTLNSPIVKWYWNFGDGTPVVVATTNASQTHTYATYGGYTVSLIVETATGCKSAVFSRPVSAFRKLVSTFSFGNACLPGGMQFNNTTTVGNSADLGMMGWSWNFGDGGTSTDLNPTHVFANTGPYNVTLTVTNEVGCSDDTTITVSSIYAKPLAAFSSGAAEACLGSAITFTDQSTASNSTVTQWLWLFGDGTTSTQQHPVKTYTAPGTYTVKLVVRIAPGCASDTATATVVVNPLPTAAFLVSAPVCVTKDITFTNTSQANAGSITQWNWNLGDGTTFSATNGNPFTHTYTATGTYNATLSVQTNKGCVSPVTTIPVVVHPLPVPAFTMPANCLTDPFSQFTDATTIADGSQAQFTYQWNFGDPNATPSNPNTSTQKNPQHKYTATGNYDVTLTVTSNNGCTASVTQNFTINGTQPQAAFVIQGGTQLCSNQPVVIQNQSTVDFGSVVKLEIFWDYSNDPSIKTVLNYPGSNAPASHAYPEFFTPATKTVTIHVVAYSGDNCLSSTQQTLTLKATPQVQFAGIPSVCADDASFQLTQASVVNGMGGTGTFSGPGVSASGVFNPSAAGVGQHTIRYTFLATNGCSNYAEQTIRVFAVPVVDAGPDRFVLEGGNAVLAGSGTGSNLAYQWSPPAGLSSATVPQPVTTPSDDITYTLTVTTGEGCSATDQVFVKVLKAPTVPNVFSPNGDGINDQWVIRYLDTYPGATVDVYNRYGQVVFSSKGYTRAWDGTYNGRQLPAGTYYYIINPKNGRQQISGFVDIVR